MTSPVQLAMGSDPIKTPFGPLIDGRGMSTSGEILSLALIPIEIVQATLAESRRICSQARRVLKDGVATTDRSGMMRVEARDRTIVYELFPVEWSDTPTGEPFIYLGVRRR